MISYIEEILDFYESNREMLLVPERMEKVKLRVLDLAGCGIAGAETESEMGNEADAGVEQDVGAFKCSGSETNDGTIGAKTELHFAKLLSGGEPACTVWGTGDRYSVMAAVFANGTAASRRELDDVTSVGASVHPGASVIPAVMAVSEIRKVTGLEFLYAVMLGYEVCNRFGMMATERVRELGMYGPAFAGTLGAVTAAGAAMKLSREEMINSFSIASSLTPVCPFISFIDGAGVKESYNGWSLFTAMAAIQMTEAGVTGTDRIMEGDKSLESFYRPHRRIPVTGTDYAFKTLFKKYACCRSVHYALTALEELMEEQSADMDDVLCIHVTTYPYACNLSSQTNHLNEISARLSIPYCMAAMLKLKRLEADAFRKENLEDPLLLELMGRITVETGGRYGEGPFALRGAKVVLERKDGTVRSKETEQTSWGEGQEPGWQELEERFRRITAGKLSQEKQNRIIEFISHMEGQEDASLLTQMLGM